MHGYCILLVYIRDVYENTWVSENVTSHTTTYTLEIQSRTKKNISLCYENAFH